MSVVRKEKPDYLIIGGGIIGLTIAVELSARFPESKIILLEKEKFLGAHASGRNSGVIHAGFYYTADSLKARFTRQGNHDLKAFCRNKDIPMNECGKLVVAKDEKDLPALDILLDRAKHNGVDLKRLTSAEAKEIDPRVKTHEYALFSPSTASVDPIKVVSAMAKEAEDKGVEIHCNEKYLGQNNGSVLTTHGEYECGFVINAAGLYADCVAKNFGFSSDYSLLPFKGLYLYASETAPKLNTNIYPVPNLANPFLGVHFTVAVDGKIKIGPTAVPCFWREQYNATENFDIRELFEITLKQFGLCVTSNFNFRDLAIQEIKKQFRPHIVDLAGKLAKNTALSDYKTWGRPGIRAQLFNKRNKKLEMDFVIEGDHRSLHILNAVSPAFTCSIPFARFVVDQIKTSFKKDLI